MKFSIFLNPQIPGSGNGPEGVARRPIGRDTESYQRLLEEVREIAVLGDQSGFHALMLTEHHFHSEGFEFSVNPLMVLTDLAARTERILLAPLGLVLPTWDPIRAAEDVALLDQFSKGRVRLGVARGYQTRWANTLAQRWNTSATASDGSGKDDRNFDVFGEILKIMKMAWTQETIRYQSDVLDGWSVPYPFDGVPDWPAPGMDPQVRRARRAGRRRQGRLGLGLPPPVPVPAPRAVAAVHDQRPVDQALRRGGHPALDLRAPAGGPAGQVRAVPGRVRKGRP